jgi:DNA-binding response OmpR family regulator
MSFRILLVETDRAAATVADHVLTNAGHRVAWVDSFADAIRQSTADCPDLMITALRLGPFNGLHLVLRCRATDAEMPAIIISEPSDLTADIERYGAHPLPKPIDPAALLSLVSQLLAEHTPHDPTSSRRWPRKRAELPATVLSGAARVVELSYGGVRLELPRPPGPGRTPIEIKLPTFGVSVQAVACWSQLAEEGGAWRCGAEVASIDSDATRTWRWIVDSLN